MAVLSLSSASSTDLLDEGMSFVWSQFTPFLELGNALAYSFLSMCRRTDKFNVPEKRSRLLSHWKVDVMAPSEDSST